MTKQEAVQEVTDYINSGMTADEAMTAAHRAMVARVFAAEENKFKRDEEAFQASVGVTTTRYGIWINQIQRFRSCLGVVTDFDTIEKAKATLVRFGYVDSRDDRIANTAYVAEVRS